MHEVLHWVWRGMGGITLLAAGTAATVQYTTPENPSRLWVVAGIALGVTVMAWIWWHLTRPKALESGDGMAIGDSPTSERAALAQVKQADTVLVAGGGDGGETLQAGRDIDKSTNIQNIHYHNSPPPPIPFDWDGFVTELRRWRPANGMGHVRFMATRHYPVARRVADGFHAAGWSAELKETAEESWWPKFHGGLDIAGCNHDLVDRVSGAFTILGLPATDLQKDPPLPAGLGHTNRIDVLIGHMDVIDTPATRLTPEVPSPLPLRVLRSSPDSGWARLLVENPNPSPAHRCEVRLAESTAGGAPAEPFKFAWSTRDSRGSRSSASEAIPGYSSRVVDLFAVLPDNPGQLWHVTEGAKQTQLCVNPLPTGTFDVVLELSSKGLPASKVRLRVGFDGINRAELTLL